MNKKVFFLSKIVLTTSLIYSCSIFAAPSTAFEVLVELAANGNSRPLEKSLNNETFSSSSINKPGYSAYEASFIAYRDSTIRKNGAIIKAQNAATNTTSAEKRLEELKKIYQINRHFSVSAADGSDAEETYKHGEAEINVEQLQVFQKYQLRDPRNTLNSAEPVFLVYGVTSPKYKLEEQVTDKGTLYVETHERFNPKWYLQIGGNAKTGGTFVELESQFKGGTTSVNGFFRGQMITEVSTPSFPTGKMPLYSNDPTKTINLGNMVFDRLHVNDFRYNPSAAMPSYDGTTLPHSALGNFETGPVITIEAQAQMQKINPAQATSYKYAFYEVDSKDEAYKNIAIVSAVPDWSTNYEYMNEKPKLFIVNLSSGNTQELEINFDKNRGIFGTSFFDLQGLKTAGSTVPYIDPVDNKNLGSLILGQESLKVTVPVGKHLEFVGQSFAEVTTFKPVSSEKLLDLKLLVPRVMGPMFPGVKDLITPYSYFKEKLADVLPEIRGLTLGGVARKGEALTPQRAAELAALGIKVQTAPEKSGIFARGNGANPMSLFNQVHNKPPVSASDNQLIIADGFIKTDGSENVTKTTTFISSKTLCLGKYKSGN